MYNSQSNAVDLTSMVDPINNGLAQLEQDMEAMLQDIQNNPTPSQAELLQFQTMVAMWSNLVQLESSVIKQYGDAIKQVVINTGS